MPPHLLNDYTSERVREEQAAFVGAGKDAREPRALPTVPLCPGCHGGEADNPKGMTEEIEGFFVPLCLWYESSIEIKIARNITFGL